METISRASTGRSTQNGGRAAAAGQVRIVGPISKVLPASDEDRLRALAILERHATTGRLRLNEFDRRVTTARRAATLADLAAVTEDLQEEQAPPAKRGGDPARSTLVLVLGAAVMTIVMLGTMFVITR